MKFEPTPPPNFLRIKGVKLGAHLATVDIGRLSPEEFGEWLSQQEGITTRHWETRRKCLGEEDK